MLDQIRPNKFEAERRPKNYSLKHPSGQSPLAAQLVPSQTASARDNISKVHHNIVEACQLGKS